MAKVDLGEQILGSNQRIAEKNRELFDSQGLVTINLMSGPGAGKTSLLERTVSLLRDEMKIGIIEGDLQTTQDADRVRAAGARAVQIETEGACHLDARMIARELEQFPLDEIDLLVIENVGNLVCPAAFELGEHARVMMLSVTEGDDKPSKYPTMFHKANVVLVNKTDLLPYVDYSLERVEKDVHRLKPDATVLAISCKTDEGMDRWLDWIKEQVRKNG
ncbi:hydrogenase nickel incorporation protein HypB [PVC group bacterium]|nr:hydrogenase nickel incorporation protein HypB [PVC group bacterium]